jgi:hypothetical protein
MSINETHGTPRDAFQVAVLESQHHEYAVVVYESRHNFCLLATVPAHEPEHTLLVACLERVWAGIS